MTARHLCAALAALFLSFLPDYARSGPKVQIRDDQRSGVISGASFVTNYTEVTRHYVELDPPEWYSDEDYPDDETQVPEGWPTNWVEILENWRWGEYVYATNRIAAPWAGSNETWAAEGGFSPHYWPSTNGISRLGPDGIRALYGRDELAYVHPRVWDAMYAWRNTSQPAAYGSVSENRYVDLYGGRHKYDTGLGVVVVDTKPGAQVVCNMVKDGAPIPVDDVVYFDGMVAFEPYAAGAENRPSDILRPDAKIALYMQDVEPGYAVLYIVARDWDTGEIRHYPAYDSYRLEARSDRNSSTKFYYGRITVCFMRTIYSGADDPVLPGVAVYVNGEPVYTYDYDNHWTHPMSIPMPQSLLWGNIRTDLGFRASAGASSQYFTSYNLPVFRPLDSGVTTNISLTSVSYGGTLRTGAYTIMKTNPLTVSAEWPLAPGDAMRDISVGYVNVPQGAARGDSWMTGYPYIWHDGDSHRPHSISVSWVGANGWADESYSGINAGCGCSITLDETCFRHGRVYLDSADGLTDEDWAELEANGLPHVESRTGPYYANVADAMAHAAYLGGAMTLLAAADGDLAFPQLENDLTVAANGKAVSDAGVQACAAPGAAVTLTTSGSLHSLSTTNLSVRGGGSFTGPARIYDAPSATLYGSFSGGLFITNSAVSITSGTYRGNQDGGFIPGKALLAVGGSFSVASGDFGDGAVVVEGASPVAVAGGNFSDLQLYGCGTSHLTLTGSATVSNTQSAVVFSGNFSANLADVGDIVVTGDTSNVGFGGLRVERAKSLTICRGAAAEYRGNGANGQPAYYPTINGDIRVWDTPVAIYGGAGDAWRPDTGSRLEVYGGSALLDGIRVGIYSNWDFPASPGVVVISNSPSVVVESGWFYSHGTNVRNDKPMFNGRFTVYDSPLAIRGGDFHALDVHNTAGSVDISGSPRLFGDVSLSAPSVTIGGGTFVSDPYPDKDSWTTPTLSINAPEGAYITNGTFNVHIAGSGISVSGGRFLWYPNQHLDSDGTISLAPGKKLVMVGSGWSDLDSRRNTYWEVQNQ